MNEALRPEQFPETGEPAADGEASPAGSEHFRRLFKEANEARDYTIYEGAMDAALEAKAASIFPHFKDVGEGSVVVDAGSGTGKLAELAAKEFHGARVFALDLSHELQDRAEEDKALTHLVYGNAIEQNFPDNSVDVKYYSTSGHEIESFGRPGSMQEAARNSLKELKAGGRLIVRDFAKPSSHEPVYMQIKSQVGLEAPPPDSTPEDIDYNRLSTKALFDQFHQEFRGGGAFDYEKVMIGGTEYIKLDPEWAHEFYLRKDYTANWRQEIKEKYTYWSLEEARVLLEQEGYENIQTIPDPNAYITKNRLEGKIGLFTMTDQGLQEVPFPPTHMVIVAEKSKAKDEKAPATPQELPAVDYKKELATIDIDEKNGIVRVGDQEFNVIPKPLVGTKKLIFRLADEPTRLLKILRSDTHNDHNAFKSMYQIIERQSELDKLGVPYLKIIDYDRAGPPYRYVIQESAPAEAVCAAELIKNGGLTEQDVRQMAEIVNKCEKGKEWQLDTNPYSWYRAPQPDGSTQLVYVSSKVYRYDEQWEFKKVGLLQWLNPNYVASGRDYAAAIPKNKEYRRLSQRWSADDDRIKYWKKYLDQKVQPESIE